MAIAASPLIRRLVLIGGGGHALVVADAAISAGFSVAGFLDDNPLAALVSRHRCLGELSAPLPADHAAIICVGSLLLRRRLAADLPIGQAQTVAAPSAVLSPNALILRGVFIGPTAVVNADARVGAHAIVNTGAIVEHECEVGASAHIAPGAVLGGRVTVGAGSLVGIGARVLPGVRIGEGCVVGAGAVVAEDVPDGYTVVGVPARPVSVHSRT